MVARSLALKIAPLGASLLLHVAACGAIWLAPEWTAARDAAIRVELVADPEPPAPALEPRVVEREHRALKPPKPVATSQPRVARVERRVEVAPAEPPARNAVPSTPPAPPASPNIAAPSPPASASIPAPSTPVAGAVPPVPSPPATMAGVTAPTGRGALAPSDTPVATSADDATTAQRPGGAAPPSTGFAIAALPSAAAVTRAAVPRGGYQVKPAYPMTARRAGVEGTTLLDVFVGTDGRVVDVVVKQSAGHPDLDRAASEAVRRWRFEPARRGADAVAMWVELPVEFHLR